MSLKMSGPYVLIPFLCHAPEVGDLILFVAVGSQSNTQSVAGFVWREAFQVNHIAIAITY
jgi:hypothetical protein